jgi:hypothetical protein
VIRDPRHTYSAEQNPVAVAELLDAIGWHHLSVFEIALRSPVAMTPLNLEALYLGHLVYAPDSGWNNLLADAITSDDVNPVYVVHRRSSRVLGETDHSLAEARRSGHRLEL